MNAETQAPPVDAAHLADHFREVESFQAHRTRSAKRTARVAFLVAGLSLLANVALAFTVASMLPLERLVPLPMWVQADGTVDVLPKMSDLPPTQSAAVTRAAIWQYVRNREGYDFADARYRYDVVSMMSASDVQDAY
ncbi:MAG: VirB8/TrbF family protein, partial [Acetobacteraceae bacterium]